MNLYYTLTYFVCEGRNCCNLDWHNTKELADSFLANLGEELPTTAYKIYQVTFPASSITQIESG